MAAATETLICGSAGQKATAGSQYKHKNSSTVTSTKAGRSARWGAFPGQEEGLPTQGWIVVDMKSDWKVIFPGREHYRGGATTRSLMANMTMSDWFLRPCSAINWYL